MQKFEVKKQHPLEAEIYGLRKKLIFDILIRSGDIRDQNLMMSEMAPNFALLWPQILGLHFLNGHISDHVAKLHGDRPRELGDLMGRKEKKIRSKT